MNKIGWCDKTLNPLTGCTPVSDGCLHCYAVRMFKRYKKLWGPFSQIKFHPDRLLKLPRKPARIFLNSMGDIFHPDVKPEWIRRIIYKINTHRQHQFIILTKRSENIGVKLAQLFSENTISFVAHTFLPNLWIGVSVESAKYVDRVDTLKKMWPGKKLISFEPLLGPVGNVDLSGISWIICGGENGPGAREMNPAWVEEIYQKCKERSIPFYFKQWGDYWADNLLRDTAYPKEFPVWKSVL